MKILFLIILLLLTGCTNFKDSYALKEEIMNDQTFQVFDNITDEALINKFTIYGKYFNLEGVVEGIYDNLTLVLKNKDFESEYSLIVTKNDSKTFFKTTELINDGINLEKIVNGNYFVLLKTNDKYITLKNNTSYSNLEYYTITRNNKNNKILIDFLNYQNINYLNLNCSFWENMENIYDIVIDPGHGGVDPGASKNGYFESHINLDYAKDLKEKLESYGLKVKLTRESDLTVSNYGVEGRVSIPYQTKAKLMLSIHMNSSFNNVLNGGFEIYVPNYADIKFASSIAHNIVESTSTIYSNNKSYKVSPGVYMRTLSNNDLKEIQKEALKKGYIPYEGATKESTYYYIIRETGGIVTGAYVDSRDKSKDGNIYYNSNHGVESYLLEMGYLNSKENLNIILKEKDKYIEAITKSVLEYLEI